MGIKKIKNASLTSSDAGGVVFKSTFAIPASMRSDVIEGDALLALADSGPCMWPRVFHVLNGRQKEDDVAYWYH